MSLVDVLDMVDVLNRHEWFGAKGWAYDMQAQVFYLPPREGRPKAHAGAFFDALVCAQPLSVAISAYTHLQRVREAQERERQAQAASGMVEGTQGKDSE